MVARVAGRVDDKVGERRRKGRRATIKALPSTLHPPSPLRMLMSFALD
jgi:hypothetical protein